MDKISHISVGDNRKIDFTEKPEAFAFLESMYDFYGTLSSAPDF